MNEVQKPTNKPAPEGYKTFLVHAAKREKQEREWMTGVLTSALKMHGRADFAEQETIRHAADLALAALRHGGLELSIDDWGELRFVIT